MQHSTSRSHSPRPPSHEHDLSHKIARSRSAYVYAKRTLDLVIAIFALLGLLPLLLIIAMLIKLDSRGPVFFVHKRVGARRRVVNGRVIWEIHTFPMCKFRSMVHNADQSLHEEHIRAFVRGTLNTPTDGQAQFKLQNDPRITRVGRFLRRTSLDELPQLFNVLRGEMSLVGPRPVPEYEVAEYERWHYERLHALPGITGLWQVYGRSQVSFDEMMAMDIEYVRTCNFWLDIKLLLRTIPAALSGEGAG